MRTILYYFTGTGNSLAAAKKIAGALGDCELVPIAALAQTGEIVTDADRVGILCPVYFAGLPVMVTEFVSHLNLSKVRYLFSVLTYGGGGGESALAQLDGILRKQTGRGLSAGYFVLMPGNYVLMYEPPTGEKQKELLKSADARIREIAEDIAREKEQPLPRSLLSSVMHSLFYSWFASHVHQKDQKFSVSDKCTACGICVSVCPAHNIELVQNKPVWNHRCELCCGCIHLCPVEAIQVGKKTVGRLRYRNPDVTIPELRIPETKRS